MMGNGGVKEPRGQGDIGTSVGLIGIVLFFLASGCITYLNVRVINQDTELVVQTHNVISSLDSMLSTMKDAETGQRGFLITGEDSYLMPYTSALSDIDARLEDLKLLMAPNERLVRLPDMQEHIRAKLAELAKTIELRKTKGFDAAKSLVETDLGKQQMDALRSDIDATVHEQELTRNRRLAEMGEAYWIAIVSGILSSLVGVLISWIVAVMVRRAAATRKTQEWLQTGQVGLSSAILGEPRVEQLADAILSHLAEYVGASAGAFYAAEGGVFVRLATYGVPGGGIELERFSLGEGLLGQAAKDKRPFVVNDVPDGYLTIGSALGKGNPRHLLISPATADRNVNSVLELGLVSPPGELTMVLMERVSETVGVAVRAAKDRASLQDLLEETQTQSEELQAQSEELRVSNEELEEQSRALRETQSRLEQQQEELEQSNSQLEEQAQLLEAQRDDLAAAKDELEAKADDLERATRYKSDFLANMSHELRTPLNSSLILAKLLADNREGNLSEEQVRYAQTIQSAGNDLLALIGDILDLSKIEAGHMEVELETLRVEALVEGLQRTFEPVASNKGLLFRSSVAPDVPQEIVTDVQRLEQILRNLISNGIKFTEHGEVSLDVRTQAGSEVAFTVSDTGIGIADDQRQAVFEAFRQADGTTNRRYGGTGLGLSISRQLAELLGGHVSLSSELGKGSSFTLTIPQRIETSQPKPPAPRASADSPVSLPQQTVPDDRGSIAPSARTILVIEDDQTFAAILYDLAHEHGFRCLIATTAEAGLALAMEFIPSAVLLDIGLPDNSGLSVLDRLKHEGRTRHIPVHVVSGSDHSRSALALGAAGYMLKPVNREELIQAFEMLESKLTQRMRRVLLVEDDPVQLESMKLLLGSRDVETVGVASAAECLEALRSSTFDCMVMDLSLPDASGFSLLETLSGEEGYGFPPVIVYTGRDLSMNEEQRLRRYSNSVIIKGVKSPERLLDEVTLFLHQVVADLPAEKQKLLEQAKHRDEDLANRLILVVEDDVRNIFALTSILEPRGAKVEIARNGREALEALERTTSGSAQSVDLVLMDIMMPEMDGLTAMREIRKRSEWKRLPIIALTAKAMKNDQQECLDAGANDYISKPLDVEKLLSLVRVWMPR